MPKFEIPNGVTFGDAVNALYQAAYNHISATGGCEDAEGQCGTCHQPYCTYCNLARAAQPTVMPDSEAPCCDDCTYNRCPECGGKSEGFDNECAKCQAKEEESKRDEKLEQAIEWLHDITTKFDHPGNAHATILLDELEAVTAKGFGLLTDGSF